MDLMSHKFICPTLEHQLLVPCALVECPYNVRNKVEGNCVLYYMQKRNLNTLLGVEVAFLYNTPFSKVDALRTSAIEKIGRALIGHSIKSSLTPRLYYITHSEVCCVCERLAVDPIKVPDVGLVWCSLQCRIIKPSRLIQLECEYHTSIENIMLIATRLFRTVTNIENILKISRDELYQTCQTYLGKSPSEIFSGIKPTYTIRTAEELIQRTASSKWISEIVASIASILEHHTSSFLHNTKPVYTRIDHIFQRASA